MTNKWINLEKKRKEKDTSVFNRPQGNFRFNNLSTPRYFLILWVIINEIHSTKPPFVYNNIQVHANAIFFTVENVCLPNKFLSKNVP